MPSKGLLQQSQLLLLEQLENLEDKSHLQRARDQLSASYTAADICGHLLPAVFNTAAFHTRPLMPAYSGGKVDLIAPTTSPGQLLRLDPL